MPTKKPNSTLIFLIVVVVIIAVISVITYFKNKNQENIIERQMQEALNTELSDALKMDKTKDITDSVNKINVEDLGQEIDMSSIDKDLENL